MPQAAPRSATETPWKPRAANSSAAVSRICSRRPMRDRLVLVNPGGRSTSARELLGREGAKHAELVAVRVGHDDPGLLTLADVDPAPAERLEPGHLGRLVGRPQVEVQPVLPRLQLRDP